ncbi:MAG: LCP family protein [Solirubrobacteraceae bacterium]
MSEDPDKQRGSAPPEYRVYGSGAQRPAAPSGARPSGTSAERPYALYRSAPRGLRARLRGESDPELELERASGRSQRSSSTKGPRPRLTWRRALAALVLLLVGWLVVSLVLFMVSAGQGEGLPAAAMSELTPGGNMLTSADTVLILGIDQRPRTGPGSKEPGADYNVAGSNSDTIMLWRIGGGTSRRLSIPRDTVANVPGYGPAKINAGFARGGPALAVKTIEQFTGLQINHVIIVNLAAFPPFIDAIGGIDVLTGKVCSNISGGTAEGGFSLYLSPGVHHLDGIQALTYARTRENSCNAADSDLTRVLHQQEILNAIRSKLLSASTFFRLPWASWAAPKVLQTDMAGPTLLSLFVASEIGGSPPPAELQPTGSEYLSGYGDALIASPSEVKSAVAQFLNG